MTKNSDSIERRKYERLEKDLNINYKVISHDSIFERTEKFEGISLDVSFGGIRILDTNLKDIESKTLLEITIDNKGEPINVIGEIKWAAPTDKGLMFGVEFVVVRDGDKLERLIKH